MNTIQLQLYIAGRSPYSQSAIACVQEMIENYEHCTFNLDIIDVLENPAQAAEHKVLATPTLIKSVPAPTCRVVGDLNHYEDLGHAIGMPQRPKVLKSGS